MSAQTKDEKRLPIHKKVRHVSNRDVVIQTDAAWNGNSKAAGLGWVIKKTGEKKNFQDSAWFVSSPLVAEGMAMREAVKKCKELGIQRVRCESDSSQLINALNSTVEPPEIYGIVADIRIECAAFESFSFDWIPRGRNSDADTLANQALCLVTVAQTA